ncbi:hypothetical protein M973_02120 [Francisella orientalis LADL 07-285A]|nr:hypothetical protein M973_02120 [Francisella orientalis LADL 07-285A]
MKSITNNIKHTINNTVCGLMLFKVNRPSLEVIKSLFIKPIYAIKSLMPAPRDCLIDLGRLSIIFVRIFKITNKLNIIPDQNVAPNTVCHGRRYTDTAVYEKKIFIPIPGATTKGLRVNNPMIMLPKADTKIALVTKALLSIPAAVSIFGFTAMI